MKTTYLKRYYDFDPKKIAAVAKIKNGKGLIVFDDTIKKSDWLDAKYYLSIGYKKSNAKEFDAFYMEQMKKFDEILNS